MTVALMLMDQEVVHQDENNQVGCFMLNSWPEIRFASQKHTIIIKHYFRKICPVSERIAQLDSSKLVTRFVIHCESFEQH